MSGKKEVWSVVTIAREHPDVIRRFVAWHLDAGAAQMTIFFDDPDDPCIAMLSHLPQVRTVACTPEFWASLDSGPDKPFTKRQNRVSRHGYEQAPQGWVLVIDADELLYPTGDLSVSDYLSSLPDDCRSVLVEPAERVELDDGGQAFRRPLPRWAMRLVYGDFAGLVFRNKGMAGHHVGKSLTRTGIDILRMRQHFGLMADGNPVTDARTGPEDGMVLLHFHGRGYDDWRRKLDYRLANVGFRPQLAGALRAARDAGDEAALRGYYDRLNRLGAEQFDALRRKGLALTPDLAIDEKIARYFPG